MQIPVILYRLAYGTAPADAHELEHGVFTTEDAAMRVLNAVLAEAKEGRVLMTAGKAVYVYAFPAHIEESDPQAAAAAGYVVDLSRLVPAPEPAPVEPPPDPTPGQVVEPPPPDAGVLP